MQCYTRMARGFSLPPYKSQRIFRLKRMEKIYHSLHKWRPLSVQLEIGSGRAVIMNVF